jgi:hypothetical protein
MKYLVVDHFCGHRRQTFEAGRIFRGSCERELLQAGDSRHFMAGSGAFGALGVLGLRRRVTKKFSHGYLRSVANAKLQGLSNGAEAAQFIHGSLSFQKPIQVEQSCSRFGIKDNVASSCNLKGVDVTNFALLSTFTFTFTAACCLLPTIGIEVHSTLHTTSSRTAAWLETAEPISHVYTYAARGACVGVGRHNIILCMLCHHRGFDQIV